MKLSPEAKARVSALIAKLTYELAVWKRQDHERILRQATTSNPRFTELVEHYSEVIRRGYNGIINAHVEGYRMDESLMDDDDENEILAQIKTMIDSNHHHIFNSATNRDFRHPVTGERIPNIDSQVRGRFDELRKTKSGQACDSAILQYSCQLQCATVASMLIHSRSWPLHDLIKEPLLTRGLLPRFMIYKETPLRGLLPRGGVLMTMRKCKLAIRGVGE